MNKLEKSIKIISDFILIDGASEKEEVLDKALSIVVKAARNNKK